MNNIRITVLLMAAVLLFWNFLSACSSHDQFYVQGSGWDYLRFPLLKPYHAIYISDDIGWVIPLERKHPLKNDSLIMEIHDVRKIAIVNNIIMVYTPDSPKFLDETIDERIFHWFVLIPDEGIEVGFEIESDFVEYIHQNNLDEPEWLEPLTILQKYDQTGCLDWIPDCK